MSIIPQKNSHEAILIDFVLCITTEVLLQFFLVCHSRILLQLF